MKSGIPDLRALTARLEAGESSSIVDELQQAVNRYPAHVAIRVLFARALKRQERWQEALEEWRHALRLCPDSPTILRSLREASARRAADRLEVRLAEMDDAEDGEPYGEMDALIQELEEARIVPDPTVQPASEDDLQVDVDDVASETLAQIYANQKFFSEAARVYDKLAEQEPEKADAFRQKAAALRDRLSR